MRKPMTKAQLVAYLAEKTGMSKKQVGEFWELITMTAYKEAKEAGQCVLPGLGKLVKQDRKARQGRNPKTGETITIPARTVVKFRVAGAAKTAILG